MQFHEFFSWWDLHKTKLVQIGREKAYAMQAEAMQAEFARGEYGNPNADPAERKVFDLAQIHIIQNEAKWYENRRPYYKVYPCVVDALCKLKLEFNCPCPKVPEGIVSIRFAEGHEPRRDGNSIAALLVYSESGQDEKTGAQKEVLFVQVTLKENPEAYYWFYFDTNSPDMTMEECLSHYPALGEYYEIRKLATRIALTTCMLADDPEIITRDVLNKQQDKYDGERNDSRRKRMEDKARNNGVFGWSIGKNVEVSPHVRRPHWALRHTGPKGSVPQIVPVKGCKVKGNKLTTVPTGFVLEDGTEVEKGQAVAGH